VPANVVSVKEKKACAYRTALISTAHCNCSGPHNARRQETINHRGLSSCMVCTVA
jgi:hypothetical protein